MIPTTLHPFSCSRAELSVRMGRSLRLLKPCGGQRQDLKLWLWQGFWMSGEYWGPQWIGFGVQADPASQGQTVLDSEFGSTQVQSTPADFLLGPYPAILGLLLGALESPRVCLWLGSGGACL